jgi:predicted anti-sigma-YlaC factor YlaD
MRLPCQFCPAVALAAVLLLNGCSIRRVTMNRMADALSGGGTAYASDNDPELVRDALPFSLKLMEMVLAETPEHVGLLTSLSSAFTQFAYGFVQQESERIEEEDFERAQEVQDRARQLYLRARDYALRGLEVRHRGFTNAIQQDPAITVERATRQDVPLLYWAGASWGAAIALAKDDPELVSDLPRVEALLYRALELNESWNSGAIHALLITYEMSRTTGEGDPAVRARRHFDRALELSSGRQAGPWVTYAESVCIPLEDRAGFEAALRKALEIDVNAYPESRLENVIMQRRARWLLGRMDALFLPPIE